VSLPIEAPPVCTELMKKLEALLFVANTPISLETLAQASGAHESEIESGLNALTELFQRERGVMIMKIAGGYQVCTKPENAEMVARFLKPQRGKLTRSQLEVLAIIAYRQPVTSAEIDAIRGVQSDYGLRALLDRRLVQETGRKQTPGRPMLYGTTQQFLHQFGIDQVNELPELKIALEEPIHGTPELVEYESPV